MDNDKSEVLLPPYVSYVTFKKLINSLKENVPARFDHSFWGKNYSGAQISHIKKALLFLGFIDDSDNTQDALIEFAKLSPQEQKREFKKLLLEKYQNQLDSLNLENATYKQLEERFAGTSQMKQKRVAFFIKAAQDCDLNLSNYILDKSKKRGTRRINKRQTQQTNKEQKTFPDLPKTTNDLLSISMNGLPFSSLRYDVLESLGVEQIQYLHAWLQSQALVLERFIEQKKAED